MKTIQIKSYLDSIFMEKQPQIRKANHTIPKCLIKQWATQKDIITGVEVYDIAKDRQYFSQGNRKKGSYSFAITDHLYVPKIDDVRVDSIEHWLASVEGSLDVFIKKINDKTIGDPLLKDVEQHHKFLLALFSLKNRSRWDIVQQLTWLKENPHLKERISNIPNRSEEIIVLENFINVTTAEANKYRKCHIIICEVPEGNLLLSDKPFIFEAFDGFSFIPLSPYFFISMHLSEHDAEYQYVKAQHNIVDKVNQRVALGAADWLVGRTKEDLAAYSNLCFKKDDVDYTPKIVPPEYLASSSYLSKDFFQSP